MAHDLPYAPFVVLAFLGAGFLVAASVLGVLAAALFRQARLVPWIGGFGLLVIGAYAALLLAVSATSREIVLAPGERKYFCEIDCHLACSVAGTESPPVLGPPRRPVVPRGRLLVVRLRTWFDEATISPRRGMSPLAPNPRRVFVEDAAGRRYDRSPEGERALAASGRASTPLDTPLRPGESYETLLVFDLAAGARDPRLFVGSEGPELNLLIGHDQSLLHRRIWFRL